MTAADLYQAIGNVKVEYLEESEERVKMRRFRAAPRVAALIAAVIVILCGITVLAVAYSLREAARADMGVSEVSLIPEWTEYPDEIQTNAEQQEAQVNLLASMCAGDQLYAYITVSPIPEEIAAMLATNSPQYEWDLGGSNTRGCSWNVEQTAYEEETQTALVKVSVHGTEIQRIGQVELKLSLTHNLKAEITYGPVVIPVTESQIISCSADVPIENTKAHFESVWGSRSDTLNIPDYTSKGKINRIAICAGYIEVELQTPPLAQWVKESHAEQIEIETPPGLEPSWYTGVLFCNNWQVSVNEVMGSATVTYKDGTSAVIDELPRNYAAVWSISNSRDSNSRDEGKLAFRFTPKHAFDLRTMESITIGNTEYSFPQFID